MLKCTHRDQLGGTKSKAPARQRDEGLGACTHRNLHVLPRPSSTADRDLVSTDAAERSRCVTQAIRKLSSHGARWKTPSVLSTNRDVVVDVTTTEVPMGPLPRSPGCWVSPGTPKKLLFCP